MRPGPGAKLRRSTTSAASPQFPGPGYAENFTYDAIGRPASHTIVSDASYRYDFTYNTQGLLDSMTFPAAGSGSPFRIRHEYDSGRVSRITNAASPGEPFWTLNARIASGNALDVSLGSAVRVVSGFAPVGGELEYRQAGTGGGTTIQNLAYEWDAAGNLKRRRDLNQGLAEEFRYDALDRLDAVAQERRYHVSNSTTTPSATFAASRTSALVLLPATHITRLASTQSSLRARKPTATTRTET